MLQVEPSVAGRLKLKRVFGGSKIGEEGGAGPQAELKFSH